MFNVFDLDRTEVTGPYNAIRMEGDIDGIKKVVYMFMDIHMSPDDQTECLNVYSRDINRYLAESFHELDGADRIYDFFLEIYQREYKVDSATKAEVIAKQGRSRRPGIYIWKVLDLMLASVNYDAAGDKVGTSEVFKNVRLHYLDIREALNRIVGDIYSLPISDKLFSSDLPPVTFQMLESARDVAQVSTDLYQRLKADPSAHIPDAGPIQLAFIKSIRKVLYNYKHTNVQKVITKRLDRYFGELGKLVSMIDDFTKALQHYQPILDDKAPTFTRDNGIYTGISLAERLEIFTDIQLRLVDLQDQALFPVVGITDCYLLRRLLDKDYVTNAITYTGGIHTINYINVLAGDFGFKVTNVSFTRASSISELNSTIKARLAKGVSITDLFIGDRLNQCSDLTDFPKRFL